MTAPAPDDPQAERLAAAEDEVLHEIGPRLASWAAVEAFVDRVLAGHHWSDRFPTAPLEVQLVRRSRSARSSYAVPATATVAIRDGHWYPLVVLHELAHLVTPTGPPHGPAFARNELELVRATLGVVAAATLERAFDRHHVTYLSP